MLSKGKEVLEIINRTGGEARFVGGCVRNYLLSQIRTEDVKNRKIEEKESSSVPQFFNSSVPDIDIATTLTPDKVTEVFERRKVRVIPTGIDFGTVTVVYESKNYEITTLRADISTDGRHAKVAYTKDWKEDASRRDFTFNALYMDIDGEITDFFDGEADLRKGIVRFIGDAEARIKEDYLRILRMFRFHAYFGKGKLPQNQLDTCKNLSDGLDIISGERIHAEMMKLLLSPNADSTLYSLQQMFETKILQKISGIDEKDFRIEKSKNIYDLEKDPNPIVFIATILCSKIPDEKIDEFAGRWKLSNKESRFLHRLREALQLDLADAYQVRRSCRINGKDEFYDYIILNYAKGRLKKNEAEKLIKFAREFAVPDFPVKSLDIMNLGVQPSKKLGDLLRKAEELWERSEYKLGKEEILKKVAN